MRSNAMSRSEGHLLLASLVVAFVALTMMFASPAHAAAFTVNSVGDQRDADARDAACDTDGDPFNGSQCTLRAAIEQSNVTLGADEIHFNITGGSEVKSILPTSELPRITEAVTIDGYSQPGSSVNTLTQPGKTNAKPLIQIGGGFVEGDLFTKDGLDIGASGVVVRGLVINRFTGNAIDINGPFEEIRIEGNFIGTNASGTEDFGNGRTGVEVFNTEGNHTIGGVSPGDRNLISGNGNAGVFMTFGLANNKVAGNLIGTDRNGTADLGNDQFGVAFSSSGGNVVGGTGAAANTIAFNRVGVGVAGSRPGNRILGNRIFSNDEEGIDLGFDGPTPNDPGDIDTGANNLQNFPTVTSVVSTSRSTTVKGSLDSSPLATFAVQLFSDPLGDDEGKRFLGEVTVTTDSGGRATFTFDTPKKVAGGSPITATATSSGGETSEFSAPRNVILDRTPGITPLSPEPGARIRDATPLIRAKVTDDRTDLEEDNVKLFVDGGREDFSYDRATDRLSLQSERLNPGRHVVKVVATDAAGNVSTRSWGFTLTS